MYSITNTFGTPRGIANTVYALIGAAKGKPLPSHTSIGCYPIVYLTLRHRILCAECASNHTNEWDPVTEGGIHWEGATHECHECLCDIESAYGEVTA